MVKMKVLIDERISLDEILEELKPGSGAVVFFVGVVKPKGGKVKELIYEIHPKFKEFVERIVREELERCKANDMVVIQYKGPRKVGEVTLIIASSSESREEAFCAVRNVLERIKHEAPVWKLEVREDGSYWLIGDKEIKRDTGGASSSGSH